MALRDQPYLPLYVNDFLSDEKLNECSAEATGVYIRLMCLMHKSSEYGYIILRERDIEKFTSQIKSKLQANHEQECVNHIQIMALALQRKMPYTAEEIENGLCELLDAGVIKSEDYKIYQPRMVRDGALSAVRAKAGSAGGKAVRNSATKKNYNEPGFLYVAEDCGDKSCHKVGITKDLRNRLNGLRRQSQRNMQFVYTAEVDDMGTTEDNVLTMLNDIRDGEWVFGHSLNEIMKAVNQCVKTTNKSQANPEDEDEIEIESDSNNTPFGKVISYYTNKFNPLPSELIVGLLQDYTDALGSDVVTHAMDIAIGESKYAWSYLNAILKRYKQSGLNTMTKVIQSEQSFEAAKRSRETGERRKAKSTGEYKGKDFFDDD